MKQYEEEIRALKLELSMHDTLTHRGSVNYDQLGEEEMEEVKKQVNLFIEGSIPEIEVNSLCVIASVLCQLIRIISYYLVRVLFGTAISYVTFQGCTLVNVPKEEYFFFIA